MSRTSPPGRSIPLDCPTWGRGKGSPQKCHCQPTCRRCGWGSHMAVHKPLAGEPVGSPPWGHEYEPVQPEEES